MKHHPIWAEFDKILTQIDVKGLVMGHLRACHYKVSGYWEADEFYEEIAFVSPLRAELVNSAIGQPLIAHRCHRWMRLQFVLKPETSPSETEPVNDSEEIGEVTLVLDTGGRIVDENWQIDVESPFVVARKKS